MREGKHLACGGRGRGDGVGGGGDRGSISAAGPGLRRSAARMVTRGGGGGGGGGRVESRSGSCSIDRGGSLGGVLVGGIHRRSIGGPSVAAVVAVAVAVAAG